MKTWNIVILPPAFSSKAADSHREEVSQDRLGKEDYLFKPDGEVEVEYEYSCAASSDSQDEGPVQLPKKKETPKMAKNHRLYQWYKFYSLSSTCRYSSHPELLGKSFANQIHLNCGKYFSLKISCKFLCKLWKKWRPYLHWKRIAELPWCSFAVLLSLVAGRSALLI